MRQMKKPNGADWAVIILSALLLGWLVATIFVSATSPYH